MYWILTDEIVGNYDVSYLWKENEIRPPRTLTINGKNYGVIKAVDFRNYGAQFVDLSNQIEDITTNNGTITLDDFGLRDTEWYRKLRTYKILGYLEATSTLRMNLDNVQSDVSQNILFFADTKYFIEPDHSGDIDEVIEFSNNVYLFTLPPKSEGEFINPVSNLDLSVDVSLIDTNAGVARVELKIKNTDDRYFVPIDRSRDSRIYIFDHSGNNLFNDTMIRHICTENNSDIDFDSEEDSNGSLLANIHKGNWDESTHLLDSSSEITIVCVSVSK